MNHDTLTLPTIHASHIERPKCQFIVEFTHPAYFNVLSFPEERRQVKVLAETGVGALKITRYHYYTGRDFELIG